MSLTVGTYSNIETHAFQYSPGNATPPPAPGYVSLRQIQITGDNSYPSGGYAISPAMFGFTAFVPKFSDPIAAHVIAENSSPWSAQISTLGGFASPTLHLFPKGPTHGNNCGLSDEVASATNVGAYSATLQAWGY